MADDSKRQTDGWIEIGEGTQPQVQQTTLEAPQANTGVISLGFYKLMEAHDKVLPRTRWHSELTPTEREQLLKAVLGDLAMTVPNVRLLVEALQKKDSRGFSNRDFPVFRVALEWLRENGFPGEAQEHKEAQITFRNDFLADLNSRGFDFKVGDSQ